MDSGNFSYKYNTKSITAGNFEIKLGNVTRKVTLQPAESLPSDMKPSLEQKPVPGKNSAETETDYLRAWKRWNIRVEGVLIGFMGTLLIGILILKRSRGGRKKHRRKARALRKRLERREGML